MWVVVGAQTDIEEGNGQRHREEGRERLGGGGGGGGVQRHSRKKHTDIEERNRHRQEKTHTNRHR